MRHRKRRRQQRIVDQDIFRAKANRTYRVLSRPDIALLDSLGIQEGVLLVKRQGYAFGGPVVLGVDMCNVAVGRDIASKIIVEEASDDDAW